jgi:hypothetical protein
MNTFSKTIAVNRRRRGNQRKSVLLWTALKSDLFDPFNVVLYCNTNLKYILIKNHVMNMYSYLRAKALVHYSWPRIVGVNFSQPPISVQRRAEMMLMSSVQCRADE